jgi:hypothetical protein
MAVDEMLTALRRDLERGYGVEAAAYLMDRPRGGWDALVTNETLDLRLDAMEARLHAELADLRVEMAGLSSEMSEKLRQQTWRLAVLVGTAQGIVVGALAAIRFA